ncbi:hypothetical protein [uncultured Alistipes sp.]|uniref:hypothetical protein n=1 Tax=uncultured Alistipes sp. TaxID=538949 RepID=UPI002626177F|nr:hypothetical protein [uncultured Alistipes sp.]
MKTFRMISTGIAGALCVLLGGSPTLQAQSVILTSDRQLEELTDPDKKIDMSTGYTPVVRSLRETCEQGKSYGSKELIVAFDEFFRQYRKDAGSERRLTPDMDEYVDKIKKVSDFASGYGMGLCLSLLSPLELGPAYKAQTGHSGRWLAYKVGFRDPATGRFSLSMWQQLDWTNNKGRTPVKLTGVKAYAFKESALGNSPFRVVRPEDIVPVEDVRYEASETLGTANSSAGLDIVLGVDMRNLRVYCDKPQLPGYDRVLVLLEYESQEMDYFNDDAPVFLKKLVEKYHDRKVNLTALYSDEMHIQQDWSYFGHHEGGQFAERYLTHSMAEKYAERFGQPLDDKYMLYFVYGAPYYEPTAQAVLNVQYVMGASAEDIHRTFLLRDRYYRMLNDGVVDLFREAKEYAEGLFGRELRTAGHASWAESPTIDLWNAEKRHGYANNYEYTPNFVWGNTVHQAAAACYDYFKWSDYLRPTGNDFAECGWNDRNYYGAAMAASIGVINEYPSAYAAAWGMPHEVYVRRMAINDAFGAQASDRIGSLTGGVHRDVDVLMLYPMNLVAAEERFGSWMAQYGYANYLTSDKLVEMGEVLLDGKIRVGDKTYGTVVALFEPLPPKGLLEMMERLVENGGRAVWFSTPPLLDQSGENCTERWQKLFGAAYAHDIYMGEIAAGRRIAFCGGFASVPEQTVLTDFLVDRIYPVTAAPGAEVVATESGRTLGVVARRPGGGATGYFGFRPRDDQSASLGYETRTLFEILDAVGAYPASGRFPGVNDNPSHVSRTTDYFVTAFPNGATVVVRHYRTHPETWEGGFSRNREADVEAMKANPAPSDEVVLDGMKANGHEITYRGRLTVAFRTDSEGRLVAFSGLDCDGVTLDGKRYVFAEKPVGAIVFAPESEGSQNYRVRISGEGRVSLPLSFDRKPTVRLGKRKIESEYADGRLTLSVDPSFSGQWLTVGR